MRKKNLKTFQLIGCWLYDFLLERKLEGKWVPSWVSFNCEYSSYRHDIATKYAELNLFKYRGDPYSNHLVLYQHKMAILTLFNKKP